jgi:hypothetical protein
VEEDSFPKVEGVGQPIFGDLPVRGDTRPDRHVDWVELDKAFMKTGSYKRRGGVSDPSRIEATGGFKKVEPKGPAGRSRRDLDPIRGTSQFGNTGFDLFFG